MSSLVQPNVVLESCESTNDLARQLGESGAPHGSWISARAQTGGRGRSGRQWQSLPGNLFLSLIVRVDRKDVWTWIPLAAAVGVVQALRAGFPLLDPRIKWPNDIWIQGAKLGGILCEGYGNRDDSFVVVGLGLNCASAPEGIDQRAVSLTQTVGETVDAEELRASIIAGVLAAVDRLMEVGPVDIQEAFKRWAALPVGTEIEWSNGARGKVLGLGAAGELRVICADGSEQRLFAEDVRIRLKSQV